MRIATLVASALLAAGVLTPVAAVAAPQPAGTSVSVTARPATLAVTTGQSAAVDVDITTDAATTVRLQRNQPDGSWADLTARDVPAGESTVDLPVPTQDAGLVAVRVVVGASGAAPSYTSGVYPFVVSALVPKRPSRITLRAPRVHATRAGGRVAVTGVVTGGRGRTVRLELRTPTGWMSLRTAAASPTGRYTIKVPTDWYYSGLLRTTVIANASYAAASSPASFRMRVSPGYRPGGHSGQWTLEGYGGQVRWDPCQPITYQVNLTGGPRHALAQIREALRQAHAATGLRFVNAGRTRAIPYRTDHRGPAAGAADLTIGFGTARQVQNLRGSLVGWGGYISSGSRIVSGAVVLDSQARLRPGFGVGPTWGTLMLHEIGHALGLDHVAEPREVMHAGINPSSQGRYQAGDLAGLRRVGAMGGCLLDGPLQSAGDRLAVPHRTVNG